MKRLLCILTSAVLLLGLTACRGGKTPLRDTIQEPLTYTALPTELKATQVGTIGRQVMPTAGGLYYKEGDLFGVMSLDGKKDSGAIYTMCQPRGNYFMVSTKAEADGDSVTEYNRIGLVDGNGEELVPPEYAVLDIMGDRFVRAIEVLSKTENEDEKLTYFMDGEDKVLCTGNWYIYDLQTGKRVPGATGTKPYIAFDCGGYVKYVTDDKVTVTALADGTAISNDVIHLKNGHYADPADHTVYNVDGDKLFTYDPNGYVPCDSADINGYIMAKKTVGDKETYALLDPEGNAASAEFDSRPVVYGQLLHVNKRLRNMVGDAVYDGETVMVYWEQKYGQLWVIDDGKTRKAVDKNGVVQYEGNNVNPVLDLQRKICYKKGDAQMLYYSLKDKDFTIGGVCLSPFIVKTADGDAAYKLVNVLTGEAILSGHLNYTVAETDNSLLYVYAQVSDTEIEVYVVK